MEATKGSGPVAPRASAGLFRAPNFGQSISLALALSSYRASASAPLRIGKRGLRFGRASAFYPGLKEQRGFLKVPVRPPPPPSPIPGGFVTSALGIIFPLWGEREKKVEGKEKSWI